MDHDFKYSYYPEGSRSPEGIPGDVHTNIFAAGLYREPMRFYGRAANGVWHRTTMTCSGAMDTVCGLKNEPTSVVTTHRSWIFEDAQAARTLCSGCDRSR